MKFNSATIDITPTQKLELSGYLNRANQTYQNICTPLELNIAILDTLIFISVDTLYFPNDIKEQILKRLNIDEKNLFISATHTHFAPALDRTKQTLGKVNEGYVEELTTKIVQTITALLKNTNETNTLSLECGKSQAHHSINRRYNEDNNILMRPSFTGHKDEEIYTINIQDTNSTKCIIINYACHPVSSLNKNDISSDFIGDIRESLRQIYKNPKLPILFLQGFLGDIRPCSIYDNAKRFIDFEQEDLQKWKNSLIKYIKYALSNTICTSNKLNIESLSLQKLDYNKIITSNSYNGDIIFHKIQINNILIIGVNAEMTSYYSTFIKNKYKDKICIPVSCVNGSFGYIPTDEMIQNGGYESGDFFKYFDINTKFKAKIQNKIQKYL